MPDLDTRTLQEYLHRIQELPAAPVPRLWSLEDDRYLKCACGHLRDRRLMPDRHSGLVSFKDVFCRGSCQKQVDKMATIVCYTCRDVVGKVEPHEDKKDHFKFEAGAVYHVLRCDKCTQGMEQAEVVERILHRRRNGLPNPMLSSQSGT
jgi:hypothetical protein